MPKYDYDMITIGAGSGGVRASRLAGGYGARSAVVESRPGRRGHVFCAGVYRKASDLRRTLC